MTNPEERLCGRLKTAPEFQIGPRDIGADLAFGVDLALFILQCISFVGCANS